MSWTPVSASTDTWSPPSSGTGSWGPYVKIVPAPPAWSQLKSVLTSFDGGVRFHLTANELWFEPTTEDRYILANEQVDPMRYYSISGIIGLDEIPSPLPPDVPPPDVPPPPGIPYLVFSTEPSGALNGEPFLTQPVVRLLDANDALDTGFTGTVTITKQSGSGTLSGDTTKDAVGGIATFTDLEIAGTGAHVLHAASPNVTAVNSGGFNVNTPSSPGIPHLVFSTEPSGAVDGEPFLSQPVVRLLDENNALVTGFTGTVTITKQSGSGTLSGDTTKDAVGGIATFTDLEIAGTGAYVLRAAATGMTSADSSSFTISAPPDDDIDLDPARGVADAGFAGGRLPRFIVTAGWKTNFNTALAASDPWAVAIAANAALSGTAGQRDADSGVYAAIMYQATGVSTWADKGIERLFAALAENLKTNNNGNSAREYFAAAVILYDWLYAGMTAQLKIDLMARLHYWAEYCVNQNTPNQYVGGMRTSDSDACIGYYLGLACLDCLDVTENTRRDWLQQAIAVGSTTMVGGINATGNNRTTARNAIYGYFATYAAGGEWFESSEYNMGTSMLWAQGYAALKSAMLTDHFPEITAHIAAAAQFVFQSLSPDLLQKFQYGDDEQPGEYPGYRVFPTYETGAALTGLLQQAGHASAALFTRCVFDLQAVYPAATSGASYMGRSAFCGYNPLATKAANRNGLSTDTSAYYGHRVVTPASNVRVSIFTPQDCGVDHPLRHSADVKACIGTEFVLYGPISYSWGYDATSVNSLLFCGLPAMINLNTVVRDETSNGWVIRTSTCEGNAYGSDFYEPPANFVDKAETRIGMKIIAGHLVIVKWHSVDVKDPSTLAGYARYAERYGYDLRIAAALARDARVEEIWHHPVVGTPRAGGIDFTTAGGRAVKIDAAYGVASIVHLNETTQELAAFDSTGQISAGEKKFQTRFVVTEQNINTMVSVYRCEVTPGAGSPPAISGASAGAITIGSDTLTFNANSTVGT